MTRLICLLLFLSLATHARADTIGAADRTTSRAIVSAALGETREIYIRTPIRYDDETAYPVVYVLDGEWNFELVAAHLDYMHDNGVMPPVIVTGVRNVNRNRDYLPLADDDYYDSGKAGAFLEFVEKGWIATIDNTYPTSGERILVGHSFGGVFALYSFFENPALFDATIAVSASAWIADDALMTMARERFAKGVPNERFVYMAPGEFDGGPTRPSGEALAALFEEQAPENLEWVFEIIPGADHFKAFTGAVNNGFNRLFPADGFAAAVREAGKNGGAGAVREWYGEQARALGWRFFPAWFDFGVAAIILSRDDPAAAIAIINGALPYHGQNANFAALSAQVFENAGMFEAAEAEYERAVSLAQTLALHPNVIHLDRLEAGIQRVRAKSARNGGDK